jgi:hypothetical protein
MYKTKNGVLYQIHRTLRAGSNSIWSFSINNKQSILGFDSKYEVEQYVEDRENGLRFRHFMDLI